jgi:isochorismate hydrolase
MNDRPTPETDALRHYLQLHGWNIDVDEPVKTIISVVCRLEQECDEAREQVDRLVEVVKSRDEDRAYLDRGWNKRRDQLTKSRAQAERLAGALEQLMDDTEDTTMYRLAKSALAAYRAAKQPN